MRKRTATSIAVSIASLLLLFAGLSLGLRISGKDHGAAKNEAHSTAQTGINKAIAVLHPTEGNKVHGVVRFTQEGDKVKVVADIEGLAPGKHGFHIHEWGDCSSKDGAAAGGHFNPSGMPHGAPADAKRHVGDLGNIDATQDGKVHVESTDSALKLDGSSSIIGRGVIVHANPDDLKTQPTGNAGGRQACGVIGVVKP
ncbi:MAG: superoxide dismutase family protein [Acidobacteria bacterium]|nr:superoxide dismutase family protein [Acidobacteriota bacterium]